MNTLVNTCNANEARELSTDELSAVCGGGGQCTNNGPSWGQLARAATTATTYAGNVVGSGAGMVAALATEGAISAVKQLRD
jgi:hypothetical protein